MATPGPELFRWYERTFASVPALDAEPLPAEDYEDRLAFKIPDPTGKAEGWLVLGGVEHYELSLDWIRAKPEGTGHGPRMLDQLTAKADDFGVTLALMVYGSSDPLSDKARSLARRYERHGFVGRLGAIMRRSPVSSTP